VPVRVPLTEEMTTLAAERVSKKSSAAYIKDRAVTQKANAFESELAEVAIALTWWDEAVLSRVFTKGEHVKPQPFDIRPPHGRGFGVRWSTTRLLFFHTAENGYANNPDPEWLPQVHVTGRVSDGALYVRGWATLHEATYVTDVPRPAYAVHEEDLHGWPMWDLHSVWVERDYPRSAWDITT
jgi:hypothetical protein